ncbi:MAG: deoxyguanosinetriphosphate triphosphohydrolase [Alphaproteobacteria bacterium]|nr:deoxyguanosinetriphosphate triphosphohydrolase [Alphaproteobacteria bacterium]
MNEHLQDQRFEAVGTGLAAYATKASATLGRVVYEPASSTRSEFQRDRDRIVHSGAFRKLRNKTQVFIENEGDYYRTRLTHSLEVAQIARSVSRVLGLNEDLTEAIALAHDLGHTCFGHTGEWALSKEMKPYGGFSHNEQTFRILTLLEHNYVQFDGLNLTWETLEGVVKHNGPLLPLAEGAVLPKTIADFNDNFDLELSTFAGPEAQVAAIADDIAYNTHDMDDGFRAGCFSFDEIKELPLFGPVLTEVQKRFPEVDNERAMHEAVREVVGLMVDDLINNTRSNIEALKPESSADIRYAEAPVARLSSEMSENEKVFKKFLSTKMYRNSMVNLVLTEAERIVREIFKILMENPKGLPQDWFNKLRGHENDDFFKARLIADYVAGMTDPFAAQEHRRLFQRKRWFKFS